MSDQYPTNCCRCGFCCLSENCPAAVTLFNIPKYGVRCPALELHTGYTSCKLVEYIPINLQENFGIGKGCCIKATVYINGTEYNFADLSLIEKQLIVKQILQHG